MLPTYVTVTAAVTRMNILNPERDRMSIIVASVVALQQFTSDGTLFSFPKTVSSGIPIDSCEDFYSMSLGTTIPAGTRSLPKCCCVPLNLW